MLHRNAYGYTTKSDRSSNESPIFYSRQHHCFVAADDLLKLTNKNGSLNYGDEKELLSEIQRALKLRTVHDQDAIIETAPLRLTGTETASELRWSLRPELNLTKLIGCYARLAKLRLSALVVCTAAAGYVMAPDPFAIATFASLCVGTSAMSASANSINQYFEVPYDSQMKRTQSRVLVRSELSPLHAAMFGLGSSMTGFIVLFTGCNLLTAGLGLANAAIYTLIYTPMKRHSIYNTWFGSVVGAIPPLMGWSACTGSLDSGALVLAGILFAWQFPHFNALSWNLRPDYSQAGYRMMCVTEPGLCVRTTLRYSINKFLPR